MSKEKPHITESRAEEHKRKQERLAEALRANLRRRKSQSRARKDEEGENREPEQD